MESTPSKRKSKGLVHGFGVNDSNHSVSMKVNGRTYRHSAYEAWVGIIRRCYSLRLHEKRPTYAGCEVGYEWMVFSSFNEWWKLNHVDGWAIDKDLLNPLSKTYSSDNCLYIPASLNSFTTAHDSKRGLYPPGASFHSGTGKFRSLVSGGNGKMISLGLYSTPIEAHKAWYKKKIEIAYEYKEVCDRIHPDLFSGLLRKIESMKEF